RHKATANGPPCPKGQASYPHESRKNPRCYRLRPDNGHGHDDEPADDNNNVLDHHDHCTVRVHDHDSAADHDDQQHDQHQHDHPSDHDHDRRYVYDDDYNGRFQHYDDDLAL